MSYREEVARTKWCPAVRFHGTPSDDCIPNRSESLIDATRCLGSACMAWRWSRAKETKAYLDAVQAHMVANKSNFNVATTEVWKELGSTFEQVEGYCGLAGTP